MKQISNIEKWVELEGREMIFNELNKRLNSQGFYLYLSREKVGIFLRDAYGVGRKGFLSWKDFSGSKLTVLYSIVKMEREVYESTILIESFI